MSIAEYIPINWGIISNPVNWVTVLLMVIIFGIAVDVLLQGATFNLSSNN